MASYLKGTGVHQELFDRLRSMLDESGADECRILRVLRVVYDWTQRFYEHDEKSFYDNQKTIDVVAAYSFVRPVLQTPMMLLFFERALRAESARSNLIKWVRIADGKVLYPDDYWGNQIDLIFDEFLYFFRTATETELDLD